MTNLTYRIGNIVGELPIRKNMEPHKFVVIADEMPNDGLELVLHSEPHYRNSVIHRQIVSRNGYGNCVGGGCIEYTDWEPKGVKLNRESTDYGPVHTEVRDVFGKMLSEKYGIVYVGHGIDSASALEETNREWSKRHGINVEGEAK